MFNFILLVGIALIFSPFLLIVLFKDKGKSAFYILSFLIFYHLIVVLITQAFHMFSYQTLIVLHTTLFITILSVLFLNKNKISSLKKINWNFIVYFILIAITSLILLSSVHYNYNGKFSVLELQEYQQAKNMIYPYPYYSDEWYAVSFINDSIESKGLPVRNPLTIKKSAFSNYEMAFHSFVAEILLTLNLDPVLDYTKVSVIINTIIILLIFGIAHRFTNNPFASVIAGISALFITSGANLPGIWNLLPITMGVLGLLLSIFFAYEKDNAWALFTGFITLIFYPPLVALWVPLYIASFITKKNILQVISMAFFVIISASIVIGSFYFLQIPNVNNHNLVIIMIPLISILLLTPTIIFGLYNTTIIKILDAKKILILIPPLIVSSHYVLSFFYDPYIVTQFFSNAISKIQYGTFTENAIPSYAIQNIIPIFILFFAVIGIKKLYKEYKPLLLAIFVGALFWIIYSIVLFRFVIEFQRVVYVTSILIVLSSSLGLNYVFKLIKKKKSSTNLNYAYHFIIIVGIIFLSFQYKYTERNNWETLVLKNVKSSEISLPRAPANKYLSQNDIRIFSNLKRKKFLSLAWKGTVIGVATGNIPLSTKRGTISINPALTALFASADCVGKVSISEKFNISYIYLPEFDCVGFKKIDKSKEGLTLYKFQG